MLYPTRTIAISIARSPEGVYAFASDPRNLPQWVTSFVTAVRQSGDDWFMETQLGSMQIVFAPHNEFGVLDHTVISPEGEPVLNPMRVVPNGDGSEVLFTLVRREGMTDEEFAGDTAMIEADLATLKEVLERDAMG